MKCKIIYRTGLLGFTSIIAVLFASISVTAYSHDVGNGADDLTPPMLKEAEDIAALQQELGNAANALRGVFNEMKLWAAASNLKACFYDGDIKLKTFFVQTAQKWLQGTSLKVDFGNQIAGYRDCGVSDSQDIRVTFEKKGFWSYIGTDSLHPDVIAKGASLNIQTDGFAFEKLNRQALEGHILHEFGHAIGLLHEHQSPESKCGDEFNWSKVLDYGKRVWGWDEAKIKQNFEQYTSFPRLRATQYDRASIMHYSLPAWMFKKGKKSRCYIPEPRAISKLDRAVILAAYPPMVAMQDKELQKRAAVAGSRMGELDLNGTQVAIAGAKIARALKHYDRRIYLQFTVAPDGVGRRSGPGALNPCEGESTRLSEFPSISCGVTPDGYDLVIVIDPDARGPAGR